jgi:small redox-active disulfide protein 2
MIIKILGTGCKKCVTLGDNAKSALEALDQQAEIVKITEIPEIVTYGVMSTPALVINDKVASVGKVLTVEEIKGLLTSSQSSCCDPTSGCCTPTSSKSSCC